MTSSSPSGADHSAVATRRADNPGVRIPPPIVYLAAFLAGLGLQRLAPLPFLPRPIALGLGGALSACGFAVTLAAIPTMLRGHGTLNTSAASAALVTSGPYRFSRNPMYVGLTLLYAGLACAFSVVWALPLLILALLDTTMRVIAPEERYLERNFGEAYRGYKARVRRWL
jgi:protein-S-isoprenylcysteine O-methyltransferase Ste14